MIPHSHYPALVLALIVGLAVLLVGPGSMTTHMALAQPPGTPLDTTADAALGQSDFITNLPYNPALPPAARLSIPAGVAIDQRSGRLFVADSLNNRVLGWPDSAAFATGAAADLVLGQADFSGTSPNRGLSVSALGMNFPNGLAVDEQGRMFVADRSNHRVLVFLPPFSNGMAATIVFGQADFTTNQRNRGHATPDADTLSEPVAIAIGTSWGYLFVADWGNNRVLAFPLPVRTGLRANYLVGQESFTTNGAGTTAATLKEPSGLAIDRDWKLLVADSGNHRLLRFAQIGGGSAADAVAGQSDFLHGQPNAGNPGPVAGGFSYPIGLAVDMQGRIYVADKDNNRIVRWDWFSTSGYAQGVLGQSDLTSGAANRGGAPAANTLGWPFWLALDGNQSLFVGDFFNNRVLRYDTPIAPPAPYVSAVAPNDVSAGSPAFRLYVGGAYFVRGSIVRWNNADRPTTFINPTSLIADIPAADVAAAGSAPSTVGVYTPPIAGQGGGFSPAQKAVYVYQRRGGDTTADLVMGAPGFTETSGVNSALDVGATLGPWGVAVCLSSGRIFVSDGNSHRVLSWPSRQAYVNAQPADLVLGQPDLSQG
jgi:sugar lactone lactonase YvrE